MKMRNVERRAFGILYTFCVIYYRFITTLAGPSSIKIRIFELAAAAIDYNRFLFKE